MCVHWVHRNYVILFFFEIIVFLFNKFNVYVDHVRISVHDAGWFGCAACLHSAVRFLFHHHHRRVSIIQCKNYWPFITHNQCVKWLISEWKPERKVQLLTVIVSEIGVVIEVNSIRIRLFWYWWKYSFNYWCFRLLFQASGSYANDHSIRFDWSIKIGNGANTMRPNADATKPASTWAVSER